MTCNPGALLAVVISGVLATNAGAMGPIGASVEQAGRTKLESGNTGGVESARESGEEERNPALALAASLALPGAGQIYAGYHKSAAVFLGVEALTVGGYLFLQSEGDSRQEEYERFAQQKAGAYSGPSTAEHDRDKYYEDLIKFDQVVWSGNYYGDELWRARGSGEFGQWFDWDPLPDADETSQLQDFTEYYAEFDEVFIQQVLAEINSHNRNIWLEAAEVNKSPALSQSSGELEDFFQSNASGYYVSNTKLEAAFEDYKRRAYDGRWAWSWYDPVAAEDYRENGVKMRIPTREEREAGLAVQAEYKRLRDRANSVYKQATFMGGLVLFNHVVSSIHAGKATSIRNRERTRVGLGLGMNPDNPSVELRLTRAF